ncbi:MAG: hypothetical protein HXX18_14665 [Bacteroidetes bacterium]|nr:hypothetical protein [Bacteroidota bacterium]
MRKTILFLFTFTSLSIQYSWSQLADSLSYPTKASINERFFEKWYLQNNFEHFIDNYYDYTIHQIETTGDFSQPAPYTFSINGGSYKWNQFYFNDFKMNDLYFPGSALHKSYMFDNNVDIDIYNANVNFSSGSNTQKKAYIEWNHGSLGDRLSNANDLIFSIAGHVSPYQRLYGTPIVYRKRVEENILLMFHNVKETKHGNLYQSIYFNAGQHKLTGFDYTGINSYFPENYLQFHIDGNLPVFSKTLFDYNGYLFSYQERDQLFSEYYYGENETAKLKSFNLSLYGKKKDAYTTGFNLSLKNIEHNVPNFSRDFIDIDGEGMEPWYADENVVELSINHKYSKRINDFFSFKTELSDGLMLFSPKQNTSFNTVYYQSTDTNYKSLYYTEWQHNSFASALLDNEAGLEFKHSFFDNFIRLKAKADITLDGFIVSTNTFVKPSWQFALDASFQVLPNAKISVICGKKQIPFDSDYIRFFSPDYMSGNTYYWNDANNDKQYQTGEKATFFTTTGGKYHHLSDNLQQPYQLYMDIPFEFRVGKRNLFTFTLQYRQYRELWGITYDKSASDYGYYTTPENINMYASDSPNYKGIFFLNNGEINYTAVNNYTELTKAASNNASYFYNNPYYNGFTFKYEYQGRKLYLSASVTAFNMVGFGSMGNGVLANNVAVLSETMANPNSYFYYLGRMDVDRSYIGRLLVSYAINHHLTMAFQYKYKDGQAFNSFGVKNITDNTGNTQIALWNDNIKGDNPFTGETSRREDCFYNTELHTKYTFFIKEKALDINLSVYNIFDLGFQLAESTFKPATTEGTRKAIDIQIPRGFMLSAVLRF